MGLTGKSHATASLHHHVTALVSHLPFPCHQTSQSFDLPPATKPVSHLTYPLPPCHRGTALPHHCVTTSPCQSVICLVPATKPVSHLTCPLPLCHRITASPCHCITMSLHHHVTTSVSHLPCPLPPNQSVIWLVLYHFITMSLWHCITVALRHCITTSVSHLPCPLPPNQSVICLAPCHQTSQSFDLPSTTASLRHCITTSPCQSVICFAPCHQTSQSFALSPATKPVNHLTCPLPPNQSVIWLALYHHVTVSPHHCGTAAPHHCISQSFALPPATKPVSHLPCPLPPNQSVIWLALYHRVTASPCHHVITALWHHITASSRHRVTTSPHEIFPTIWVWIWLDNTTQHSSDWLIVLTTANQITGIEKPNYHKTLIFFPTTSLKRSHEARIDQLADSNEPATSLLQFLQLTKWTNLLQFLQVNKMNKFASVSSINKMNKFASVSSINKMNKFASY